MFLLLFNDHTTSKINPKSGVDGQNNAGNQNQDSDHALQEQNSQRSGQLQNTVGGMRNGSKKFSTIMSSTSNENQNNGIQGGGLGNGNGLIAAAKALLRAVALNTVRTITNNPVVMLAKNFFNKTLVQNAVSLLEAAQIDEILGAGDKQQIILLLAQAKTVDGEASQNIDYWKQVIQENKQLERQTHDMAKAAG